MTRKLLPFLVLLLASPCWATWTCAQGGPGCTVTTVRTCTATATSCSITVSSTHAHAVEVMCGNMSTTTGTLTAATTDGTWTIATSSLGADTSISGRTECEYNLNATGSVTTITCTQSASLTLDCEFFEFTGTGSSFTFDTANNIDDSTACTSCSGVALTLTTSNNYILVQSAFTGATVTALSQSYNFAGNATSGNGSAYKMNVTTAGTTPSWTNSASFRLASGAIAIYEITGAAAPSGFNKRQKIEQLEGIR